MKQPLGCTAFRIREACSLVAQNRTQHNVFSLIDIYILFFKTNEPLRTPLLMMKVIWVSGWGDITSHTHGRGGAGVSGGKAENVPT